LDRQTVNRGDNLMGIHVEYGDGTAVFSVDVGFDRLDALEDVDFQTYGIGVLGGRRVEVVRSTVFAAGGPLWGASWTEKGADPGCAEVTAVGREMSLAAFRAAVTAVRVG